MARASKSKTDGKGNADGKTSAAGKGRASVPTRSKKQRRAGWPLEEEEVRSIACHYFCSRGMSATEIKNRLMERHSVEVTREEVYRFVRDAALRGWIHYDPPQHQALQHQIQKKAYPWLHEVSVVPTAMSEDVACRGAEMLLELLQQHYVGEEVHIGFSGGSALRTFAKRFAELLRGRVLHLPKRIVFHALVAGFDVFRPATDPNAFFTYFDEDPAMEVETSFVALHSPALGGAELDGTLRRLPGVGEAFERAGEIDIIVTATSSWKDEHCVLRGYMGESTQELEKEGCLGDMLWQPIGPRGPLDLDTHIRAMTIMKLSEVAKLVEKRKVRVLLVAGPCAACHRPKTEVVKAILEQEHRLVTHLAVDTRCARSLIAAR
jgi:DNA-binding transcriptional regulator LsrR (DeoR family)